MAKSEDFGSGMAQKPSLKRRENGKNLKNFIKNSKKWQNLKNLRQKSEILRKFRGKSRNSMADVQENSEITRISTKFQKFKKSQDFPQKFKNLKNFISEHGLQSAGKFLKANHPKTKLD